MFWDFLRGKMFRNKDVLPNISLVVGKCYRIEKINGIIISENNNLNFDLVDCSKNNIIQLLNDNNIGWKEYPYRLSLVGEDIKLLYGSNPLIFDLDKKAMVTFNEISEYLGLCAFYKTNVCESSCTEEEIFKCNNLYDKVCLREDIVPRLFQYENFRPHIKDEVFEFYEGSFDKSYLVSKLLLENSMGAYKPELFYVQKIIDKNDVVLKYRESSDCRDIIQKHIDYNNVVKSLNYLKKMGYNEKYLKFYYKTWIDFIDAHCIDKEDFLISNYEKWAYHNVGNCTDRFLLY